MPLPRRQPPYPLLLEPGYWRQRLTLMARVSRGLLILPRPELSTRSTEIVEWRLRAHDGLRLSGFRASSPIHATPKGAWIHQSTTPDLEGIRLEGVPEGCVEFILVVPSERKLEDRVLDLLRVFQVAMAAADIPANEVRLVPPCPEEEPDEFMIVTRLLRQGLL
jgi:hypothetical protein